MSPMARSSGRAMTLVDSGVERLEDIEDIEVVSEVAAELMMLE